LIRVRAGCARATAAGRRRLLPFALLAGSVYAAVAIGRTTIYGVARAPVTMVAQAGRYHYLPLALVTLLVCAALAALAGRGRAASRAVSATVGLWVLCRRAMLVGLPL